MAPAPVAVDAAEEGREEDGARMEHINCKDRGGSCTRRRRCERALSLTPSFNFTCKKKKKALGVLEV